MRKHLYLYNKAFAIINTFRVHVIISNIQLLLNLFELVCMAVLYISRIVGSILIICFQYSKTLTKLHDTTGEK